MDNLTCERPFNPNSFSFCGIWIEEIGLEYAPDNANTYVYKPATYKSHEETWDGHDGGYYYGTTTQPKDFVLRCYYENADIRSGLMHDIYTLFRRGRTGKLIFSNRPWLWYNATVSDVDISQMYNYENGIVTIKLRAYYPFARSDVFFVENNDEDQLNNSNLLSREELVPQDTFENITEQTEILLYNPGTETAQVIIEMQGEAPDGFTIANAKTHKLCKFVGLTDSVTTDVDKTLVCNSINGKTYLIDSYENTEYAFLYHDKGFLDLPPSDYMIHNVNISYEEGSTYVTADTPIVFLDIAHKYIYVNDKWMEIASQISTTTLVLTKPADTTGSNLTDIIDMNKIVITPVNSDNFNLTHLKFTFNPTFA